MNIELEHYRLVVFARHGNVSYVISPEQIAEIEYLQSLGILLVTGISPVSFISVCLAFAARGS